MCRCVIDYYLNKLEYNDCQEMNPPEVISSSNGNDL